MPALMAHGGWWNGEGRKQVALLILPVLPEHRGRHGHGPAPEVRVKLTPKLSLQFRSKLPAHTLFISCNRVFSFLRTSAKMVVLLCRGL